MNELKDLLDQINRLNKHTAQTWALLIIPNMPKEVYIVDEEDKNKFLIVNEIELNAISFSYASQLLDDALEPFERIYEIGIRLKGQDSFIYSKYNANEEQKNQMIKQLTYDETADLC